MELVTGKAGTDHISAADLAAMYRGLLVADDVVLAEGNKLSCTMLDANTAEIGTGSCMLQAHHARVETAEQLTIDSGSPGYKRNDLIVARYTLGTGNVQGVYLAVLKGTAVLSDPQDPSYATGSIDGGTTLVEFPLWRIPLDGVTVGTPERVMPTIDALQDQITALGETVSLISSFPSMSIANDDRIPLYRIPGWFMMAQIPCIEEPTNVSVSNAVGWWKLNTSESLTFHHWSYSCGLLQIWFNVSSNFTAGMVYGVNMDLSVS